MTDIINLNSIRSDNCDCNKPKKTSCGCNNHNVQPCHLAMDLGDQYFKVKNLFGELKSEWQRAEARLNLGVTDIIDLRLTKFGEGSGDSNIWQMEISKGGSLRLYDFVVKNGEAGESATIAIGDVFPIRPGLKPTVNNVGSDSHAILNFGIPSGEKGDRGDRGESAFEIANKVRVAQYLTPFETEASWLESLKGERGEPGRDASVPNTVASINLIDYKLNSESLPNGNIVSGNMYIWEVTWTNGTKSRIWIPEGGGISAQEQTIPLFLYKKHSFDNYPTNTELNRELEKLLDDVNENESTGRTINVLTSSSYNWKTKAPQILNLGLDFIYMAVTTQSGNKVAPWQVIQLTGARGNDGINGQDGLDGQDCDCSGSGSGDSSSSTLLPTNKFSVMFCPEVTFGYGQQNLTWEEDGISISFSNRTAQNVMLVFPASAQRMYVQAKYERDSTAYIQTVGYIEYDFSDFLEVIIPSTSLTVNSEVNSDFIEEVSGQNPGYAITINDKTMQVILHAYDSKISYLAENANEGSMLLGYSTQLISSETPYDTSIPMELCHNIQGILGYTSSTDLIIKLKFSNN